jgi:prepilin-type N-terminal cleavage/methylation domain-containing protein
MSREAGYTLVEMLAALAVIGLAFGGLAAGSHILLRQQRGAASDVAMGEELATAQASLKAALAGVKHDDILLAEPRRIEIACRAGERCDPTPNSEEGGPVVVTRTGADHVALTPARGYVLTYQTTAGAVTRWAAGSRDSLTTITLTADKPRATPVAVVWLREAQAYRCEYDVIIAACRSAAPER